MSEAILLGLVTDLFFVPRIGQAAQANGLSAKWVDTYLTVDDFMRLLDTEQPAIIVLDLNSPLPWAEWLPAAKEKYATRRIPWLVYGSHMDPRRLKAARHAGAEKVVPRSEFSEKLPELIKTLIDNKKEALG